MANKEDLQNATEAPVLTESQKIEKEVSDKVAKLLTDNNCVLDPVTIIQGGQTRSIVNVIYKKPESEIITPEKK